MKKLIIPLALIFFSSMVFAKIDLINKCRQTVEQADLALAEKQEKISTTNISIDENIDEVSEKIENAQKNLAKDVLDVYKNLQFIKEYISTVNEYPEMEIEARSLYLYGNEFEKALEERAVASGVRFENGNIYSSEKIMSEDGELGAGVDASGHLSVFNGRLYLIIESHSWPQPKLPFYEPLGKGMTIVDLAEGKVVHKDFGGINGWVGLTQTTVLPAPHNDWQRFVQRSLGNEPDSVQRCRKFLIKLDN